MCMYAAVLHVDRDLSYLFMAFHTTPDLYIFKLLEIAGTRGLTANWSSHL